MNTYSEKNKTIKINRKIFINYKNKYQDFNNNKIFETILNSKYFLSILFLFEML